MPVKPTTPGRTSGSRPATWRSRWFISAIIAIGGMQLMATMDGMIAVVALPKVQNELGLSAAGRSWVITAYVLSFGGLLLLGGRLGDTFGRKRTFTIGVALFTGVSALCGIAWNGGVLIFARLLQGVAGAIIAPTAMPLVATTFEKGPLRNTAMAALGAVSGLSGVLGLVVGGALTEVSWRLVFLVNVPLGLLVLGLAHAVLRETQKERMKLDAAGAGLATLGCTAAVFGFTMAPEKGLSPITIGSGVVAVAALVAFAVVERTAKNPILPFRLFLDRSRLATFAATFLNGGVIFTLTLVITVYVQELMGYSTLRAGICFIPFVIGVGLGTGASPRLVTRLPPRVVVIMGSILMLGALLYVSTINRSVPYFPDLLLPFVVAGVAAGMIVVPLSLSLIASVGLDQIGPTSAISLVLSSLGGPMVLAVVQAAITWRTLSLGGIVGPPKSMNVAQLNALDRACTYGMLWLAGVVIMLGIVALFIGYSAQQVAHAQEVRKAMDVEEL
jgi:EmrB/QacA subfamily drug resistance transporter